MAVLLLIRHALTEATGKRLSGTTPGIHLSTRGKEQAGALADRLSDVAVRGLYTSPLERCVETAQPVGEARGLEPVAVPGVIEIGYGRWTGRPLGQLARTALWRRVQQAPSSARFPDGETLAGAQRRAVDALDEIARRHGRHIAAIVTHADVIRLALAHYAGVHLDLFQRLIVSPASVSAIMLGDSIPRILRMNDTGTLRDLDDARRAPRRIPRARPGSADGAEQTRS